MGLALYSMNTFNIKFFGIVFADFTFPLKIKAAPIMGAMAVPSELNACDKFNRLEAPISEPKAATYGLAATCNMVIPPASVKYASMKMENSLKEDAG